MDGTKNKSGVIEYCTWLKLRIGKKDITTHLLITDLRKETMILGLPWLEEYNPKIDWDQRSLDITTIQPKVTNTTMNL